MKIARRMNQVSISPTLAVMQEAVQLRRQGIDIIDLGPGEPDFPTPEAVQQSGIEAIRTGFTKYTVNPGIEPLRGKIAEKFNRESGGGFTAANVIVTNGAKSAIFSLVMTVFEEGDEVLIPAPYWVTFPEAVKLSGARPVAVPTREENGFVLQASDLEPYVGPATKGLIINSPNNPSGAVIPAAELAEVAAYCKQHDIFLLSDETYDRFTYQGVRHASLAASAGPQDESCAITGSFSKTYSMTGWRIGYLVGHPELIRKVNSFQSHQCGNACSISQRAALAALDCPDEVVEGMLQEYSRRRRLMLESLNRIPGFSCPVPYGAFYAFPNISECLDRVGVSNSVEFSKFLLTTARVVTVPGSAFGTEGFIRLSYATSMENLEQALSRIQEAVQDMAVA